MIIGFPRLGVTGECLAASRDLPGRVGISPEPSESGQQVGRTRRKYSNFRGPLFLYVERIFCPYKLYFPDDRVSCTYIDKCGMNIGMLSSVWSASCIGFRRHGTAVQIESRQPRPCLSRNSAALVLSVL